MLAQIHQRQARRLRSARPLRQHVLEVAAGGGVLQGFQRRRRRPEHDGHGRRSRPDHRKIARRVAKSFVLLVRGIVLLVDDDQGETRQRAEHGGTRADDDARLAAMGRAPGIAALGAPQPRMHRHHAGAKAPAKTLHQLRRQRNFRHQDQRLSALRDRRGDDPHIDFGLAAARDPIKKMRREAVQSRGHGGHALGLMGVQGDVARLQLERLPLGSCAMRADPASLGNGAHLRRIEGRADVGAGGAAAFGQPGEQRPSLGTAPRARLGQFSLARRGERPPFDARGGRLSGAHTRRQRGGEYLADRMVIVVGRPGHEVEGDRVEDGLLVQNSQRRLEFGAVDAGLRGDADQHPDEPLPAERHQNPHAQSRRVCAERRLGLLRRSIVKDAPQRSVERDLQNHRSFVVHKNCG